MTTPRQDIRIAAPGGRLAAYFYRPQGQQGPVPCVVMAHGFSATRDDGLPDYAEAFAAAGYAVVVFDYRHFGASDGEPRQHLDVLRQHEDYRRVVHWARHTEGIDPDRIVLWGTSFSGGHVLAVAAGDPRIAAVIAQAPFTDGLAVIRRIPLPALMGIGAAWWADRFCALIRRGPVHLRVVGEPGTVAIMTQPDAVPGFTAMLGPNTLWRNEITARALMRVVFFRSFRLASRLRMPVLFCVCDADLATPPGPSVRAARAAPRGELRRYPYGHFDINADPQAKADQVDFLRRVWNPDHTVTDPRS